MAGLSAARGIGFGLVAYDMASQTMLRANSVMRAMNATADTMGKVMPMAFGTLIVGAASAMVGMAGLGKAMSTVKEATEFGLAIERVGIVTRSTGKEFEELKGIVQRLGLETEFTATEVANASQILAQAGFSTRQLKEGLIGVTLDLTSASGGMINTTQAAAALTTALKVFGNQMEGDTGVKARALGDAMTRMTQLTKLQFSDLERAFAGISGEARIFQQDYYDVLALMGVARDVGFSAAGGTNALRISMRNMITRSEQYEKVMKSTGVSVYDLEGNVRSVIDVLGDLTDKWDAMGATTKQRIEDLVPILTKRGLRGAGIIQYAEVIDETTGTTLKGRKALNHLADAAKSAAGVMEDSAERIRKTFWGTLKRISGGLTNLAIIIGETVLPWLSRLAEKFFNVTVALNEFAIAHKGLMKWLFIAFTLGSALMVVAGVAAIAFGALVLLYGALSLVGWWAAIATAATRAYSWTLRVATGDTLLFTSQLMALRIGLVSVASAAWALIAPLGAIALTVAIALLPVIFWLGVYAGALKLVWNFMRGTVKASEPLTVVLQALAMLWKNNFRVTDEMMQKMKKNNVVGVVTKLGSALLWVSRGLEAAGLAWTRFKGFFSFDWLKSVPGLGAMGDMVVEGMKWALGDQSLDQLAKTLTETMKKLTEKVRVATRDLMVKMYSMEQKDWDQIFKNVWAALKASGGLLWFMTKLSVLILSLATMIGWAIVKGVVQGIWDARWKAVEVLAGIFKWIFAALGALLFLVNPALGLAFFAMGGGMHGVEKIAGGLAEGGGAAPVTMDNIPSPQTNNPFIVQTVVQVDGKEILAASSNAVDSERGRQGDSPSINRFGSGSPTNSPFMP
jgi:TP901 family phage tail tape measure protein